ncbi:MAG: hypothetical protein PVH28_05950 [Desulfobacterales bacterium]|jgi:hypothetical protein
MVDELTGITALETKKGYSWFFILVSWEHDDDDDAIDKWKDVYNFLKRPKRDGVDPLREEIADEGLIGLNLIGKRKFVIAGQTRSNRPLQKISSMIALKTGIKVDVFAATSVFELGNINKDLFGIKKDPDTDLLL